MESRKGASGGYSGGLEMVWRKPTVEQSDRGNFGQKSRFPTLITCATLTIAHSQEWLCYHIQ
jgi:hypothetical protein